MQPWNFMALLILSILSYVILWMLNIFYPLSKFFCCVWFCFFFASQNRVEMYILSLKAVTDFIFVLALCRITKNREHLEHSRTVHVLKYHQKRAFIFILNETNFRASGNFHTQILTFFFLRQKAKNFLIRTACMNFEYSYLLSTTTFFNITIINYYCLWLH